jgi:hypothetical protein
MREKELRVAGCWSRRNSRLGVKPEPSGEVIRDMVEKGESRGVRL